MSEDNEQPGFSIKAYVQIDVSKGSGSPEFVINDGWDSASTNILLYKIMSSDRIHNSTSNVVENEIVDYNKTGWYKAALHCLGTVLPALIKVVKGEKLVGIYVPNNLTTLNHSPAYKMKTASAIAEDSLINYGSEHDLAAPFRHLKEEKVFRSARMTNFTDIFEWAANLSRAKISEDHHIHYSATDAINIAKTVLSLKELLVFTSQLRTKQDLTTTAAAGIILYAVSLKKCIFLSLLRTNFFSVGNTMNEWYSFHKKNTPRFKLYANNINYDVEQFFETEVLVNRLDIKLDWDQEHINRTSSQVTNIPDSVIRRYAKELFATAKATGKSATTHTWSSFWEKRWEWSTNGATNYPYENSFKYPSWRQKTKFMTYLQMESDLTLDKVLINTPAIIAKPSVKYEWGKVRAIYGCDDISHLVYTFVMGKAEELLPSWIPLSGSSNDNYVSYLMDIVKAKGFSLCLDYEDFNSQHSSSNMITVLEAFFEVFGADLSEEQRSAIPWILESLNRQYVMPTGANTHAYYTEGTLFSGWRLTTFMNTVLNYCYTSHLIHSSGAKTNGTLHSGDDVYMHVDSPNDFVKIAAAAEEANIRLSTTKCFVGGIEEFLRKNHRCKGGQQYLARGISTLVHGRTESLQHADLLEAVKANETRLAEAHTRGMSTEIQSVARQIYNKGLLTKDSFRGVDPAVLELAYELHPVNNGLNPEAYASSVKIDINHRSTGTLEGIVLPGIADYVGLLSKYLTDKKNIKRLHAAIVNATNRVLFSSMSTILGTTPVDLEERRIMRALYKQYAKVKENIHYGKSRLIGLDIVNREIASVIRQVDAVIGGKSNYYEWLSILV